MSSGKQLDLSACPGPPKSEMIQKRGRLTSRVLGSFHLGSFHLGEVSVQAFALPDVKASFSVVLAILIYFALLRKDFQSPESCSEHVKTRLSLTHLRMCSSCGTGCKGQSIFKAERQNQPTAGVQDSIKAPIAGSHFPITIEWAHQKQAHLEARDSDGETERERERG